MICNDGFAKSLKPLKELLLKVNVPNTTQKRLFERAWEIIKLEKLEGVDHSLVKHIVDQSNGDTRSCINSL
jgi:DNA polymerase III delta prime subunit